LIWKSSRHTSTASIQ